MAEFKLDGETITIPKFKLREIRAVAPFIDRINANQARLKRELSGLTPEETAARLAEMSGLVSVGEMMADLTRVLAVGVLHARGLRPYSVTDIEAQAELIEADIGVDQLDVLNTAFEEITAEAGLRPAGPPKPPVAGAEAASETVSTGS